MDNSNSLGIECFQGLISLGFWKKCIYLMDYQNALSLTCSFADFKNFKIIFLSGN